MTTTGRDQSLAARVVVRVLDGAGDAVGAGFLVGPDRVATCAHVVASALRADPYAATPPAARVRLDFPLLPDIGGAVEAEITRWVPIEPDGSGDVAVLRLIGAAPDEARMPPLRRVDQLWDRPFRVLGFPEGMTDGVWSTGRFRGVQGISWFQLQCAADEQPIVEGFSGSPVWDEESGAVVGMTVAADASGKTRTAFLIPIDRVLGLDPELLPCPYRGLEPFDEEHAAYFFGRDADIDQLADLATAQPLVAVAGPSGVGKSSLVRAGLVPRLRAAGTEVTDVALAPGGSVTEALAAALRPFVPPESVPSDEVLELAAAVTAPLMLVVDQFEELAAADPEAAQELLELIGDLVRPGTAVRAVLTLRWATLDDVVVPELATLLRKGTFLLPPMSRAQLREAIVAPAERAPGLSFEAGLVERILDDAAGEPGGLPLVESLLTELWERREGGYLTLTAYEQAGGVGGVVATHAEKVVAGFTDLDDEVRLKRIFTTLAAADREGRFTRRRRRWDELAPELRPLVQRLAAGRLLVVEPATTGERTVQLAHQALIDHWPRLHDWLTEDRDFLAWRDQLDGQRERWESAKRDEGALLRGTALAASQDWLPARAADVSQPSRDYVHRSRARQRREVRRWRVVTAVLAVLVLAAGALAMVAVDRSGRLGEQLRLSNAELMAQASLIRTGTDPAAATVLALAAWRLDPTNPQARSALLRQYLASQSVEAVFAGTNRQALLAFTVAQDGTTVALDGNRTLVLHGLLTGSLDRWVVPVPAGPVQGALSADGRFLAVADQSGAIWTWDLVARRGPERLSPPGREVAQGTDFDFSPDGTRLIWLASAGSGVRELEMRDVTTHIRVPHHLGKVSDPAITAVRPTADPTLMIMRIGDADQPDSRLVVRSLVDGSEVRSYPPGSAAADGGALVVSCEQIIPGELTNAVVRHADTGLPTLRYLLAGPDCAQQSPRSLISADGRHIVERRADTAGGDYDVLRIRSLTEQRSYDVTIPPGGSEGLTVAQGLAVLPAADGTATVLLPRGSSILRLRALRNSFGDPTGEPPRLLLSNDGRYVVAVEQAGYTAFDRASSEPLGRLTRTELPDTGPAISSTDNALHLQIRAEKEFASSEYTLPGLTPAGRYVLPLRPGDSPADEAATITTDRRSVTFSDGILSAWDRATGVPVGEPVDLATTPAEREWYRDHYDSIVARPGHPDEVAVLAPANTIELWDVAQGRRVRSIPREETWRPYSFAFSPDGSRLAALTSANTLEVRDVDGGELVQAPIEVPNLGVVIGFTADGYVLVSGGANGDVERMAFRDLRTGRETGSIRISIAHDRNVQIIDGTRITLVGVGGRPDGGALPVQLELTAQAWFDRLCQVSDRPFTEAERTLLPAGASADPPCA